MLNYRIECVLVCYMNYFSSQKYGINNITVITAGGWADTKLLNVNSHKKRVRVAASQNHIQINIS